MPLNRHNCDARGSADAAERRDWLAYVRRVVGVVLLQWLLGRNPPKLQKMKNLTQRRKEAKPQRFLTHRHQDTMAQSDQA